MLHCIAVALIFNALKKKIEMRGNMFTYYGIDFACGFLLLLTISDYDLPSGTLEASCT